MKTKGQVALAVGAGYMLGRTHKMRMALMLAAAGATGRFPGGPRDLLERGTKMLATSPEFAKISGSVKEELMTAAKAAAVTAASHRIDALSNRLLAAGDEIEGTVSDATGPVGEVTGIRRLGHRKHTRARDEDDEDAAADEETTVEEITAEEQPDDGADEEPTRSAPRRTSSTGNTRATSKPRKAKSDTNDDRNEEEEPTRSRRTRARPRRTLRRPTRTEMMTMTNAAKKLHEAGPGDGDGASSVLQDSIQNLVSLVAERALSSVSEKVTNTSERLNDYATGDGEGGLLAAVTGSAKQSEDGSPLKSAISGGWENAKQTVKDKTSDVKDAITGGSDGGGGGSGKGKKLKLTNIVESIDVGVPVQLAYDQWTQFTDFPSFMKKVERVEQESDEKLEWKAQVFLSHRTWESTILEQVPDERIVWRSKGAKGYVDGAVTFHEMTPDLTRILLILEYHPKASSRRQEPVACTGSSSTSGIEALRPACHDTGHPSSRRRGGLARRNPGW